MKSNATETMPQRSSYRRPRIRKSRGRGLRTTNGCITCRKRHLKCDEAKPICGPCVKKKSSCEFASPGRRASDFPASEEPVTDTVVDSSTHEIEINSDDNKATPGTAPKDTPSADAPIEPDVSSWPDPSNDISSSINLDQVTDPHITPTDSLLALPDALSPSNASYAAVRWFGLLANDAARESSQIPTIHNSWANQSLALDHSTESQDQPSPLQRATQVLDSPASIYNTHDSLHVGVSGENTLEQEQIWQSQGPIELLPAEATLFEHFVNRVSPWIDLFDPTDQFSIFVSHLAIYNAGLMNAILALAYRHMALNPHLNDHNIPSKHGEAALQYYYQTLHYVQKAMQYSGYKRSLELLATTLIISAYEMLDNSTKDWERHLEGVFLIQRSQTIHGESGGLHSAVWWAWLCQDIWAAVCEKRKTLTFWVPQKPLSVLSPHELAARSIYNTAKVINYCFEVVTEADIGRRVQEAACLREMLDNWQQHLTIEFSPLPLCPRQQTDFQPIWIRPPSFAVAVQFFHVSHILLLAHEPSLGGMEQYLKRQGMIKHCVENICGLAVTLKDYPSSLMSSQALYIAGKFTQGRQAREAILELLDACRERVGWPVRSLGEELQHFWEDQEPTSATTTLPVPSIP